VAGKYRLSVASGINNGGANGERKESEDAAMAAKRQWRGGWRRHQWRGMAAASWQRRSLKSHQIKSGMRLMAANQRWIGEGETSSGVAEYSARMASAAKCRRFSEHKRRRHGAAGGGQRVKQRRRRRRLRQRRRNSTRDVSCACYGKIGAQAWRRNQASAWQTGSIARHQRAALHGGNVRRVQRNVKAQRFLSPPGNVAAWRRRGPHAEA